MTKLSQKYCEEILTDALLCVRLILAIFSIMKNKTLLAVAILVVSAWAVVVSAYASQIQTKLAKGEKPKMITFGDGSGCSSTTTTGTNE